jgi:hypothetical protein
MRTQPALLPSPPPALLRHPVSELSRVVKEARPCEAGDNLPCSGGGSQCTAWTAVKAAKRQAVEPRRLQRDCGSAMVECPACLDPQCVDGLCACRR